MEINLKKVDSLTKYASSFFSQLYGINLQLDSQVCLFIFLLLLTVEGGNGTAETTELDGTE